MMQHCNNCDAELVEKGRFCHRCGIPLTDQLPEVAGRRALQVARWGAVFAVGAYLLAWLVAFADPEASSVIGLVAMAASLVQLIAGLISGLHLAVWLGIGHVGIYVFLAFLVNLINWTPREAIEPFVLIGGAYLLCAFPATVVLFRRKPLAASAWVCKTCGYLLVGLTEPRCPECGTPFDRKTLVGEPPGGAVVNGSRSMDP